MIIRVESSLTLQTKDGHYVKEHAALELDHSDIAVFMIGGHKSPVNMTKPVDPDEVREIFNLAVGLTADIVFDAVESQLEMLEE